MNSRKRFGIATLVSVFGFTAFVGTAPAATVVYAGYDVGSTSLAGSPNATTAAAAFDAAAGTLSIIDFESALPVGVNVSGGSVDVANVACPTPDIFCYATSPINVYRNNGAVFTFADPISAFGAYFTGWQITGQTITIGYSGGGTEVLAMPAGDNVAGGTLFFGFINAGSSIASITYFSGDQQTTGADLVGIDDVRFASVVPVPAAVWLFGSALGLLGLSRRRFTA